MSFSPLSNLYRLFQHDNGQESEIWNVSCGPIDLTHRTYRVLYEGRIDREQIVGIEGNWKLDLDSFVQSLRAILSDATYPTSFRTSCMMLFMSDPWISEFTKTHPLPYIVSSDDV